MDIQVLQRMFRSHPWHGVPSGADAPEIVNAYIEMIPTDVVKYEVDKPSGILKIDRPQKYSSQCPTLYGFIPRTYCGRQVGEHCSARTGEPGIRGDGDPIDICVITERPIQHGDILLRAVPIGGFRLIDRNEADDKIVALLHGDLTYGAWRDISDLPPALVERLHHYFLTYKDIPGDDSQRIHISEVYGSEEAKRVIELSRADYLESFPEIAKIPTPE